MANPGDVSSGTSTNQVTLAAPGQGRRWYLTYLEAQSNASAVFTVQSPAGSNKFRRSAKALEVIKPQIPKGGLAGIENQALIISVDSGNYDINYKAVVR